MCCETGFEDAADRKTRRYADLVEEVRKQGYRCQVGSRGVIHEEGLNEFRCCLKPVPNKEWKKFLIALTNAAIEELQHIWSNRNHKNPPQYQPVVVTFEGGSFIY